MIRRVRSAITGRFVKRATANRHPRETLAETVMRLDLRPRTGRVRDVELERAVDQLLAGEVRKALDDPGLTLVRRPDVQRLERLLQGRGIADEVVLTPSDYLPLEQALVELLAPRAAEAEGPRIVVWTPSRDRARIVFRELERMAATHPELTVHSGIREVRHRTAHGWLCVRGQDEVGLSLEPTLEVHAS